MEELGEREGPARVMDPRGWTGEPVRWDGALHAFVKYCPEERKNSLSFGDVVRLLRDGKHVRRAGWSRAYLCLKPAGEYVVLGVPVPCAPRLFMVSTYGRHSLAYLDGESVMAEDWEMADG